MTTSGRLPSTGTRITVAIIVAPEAGMRTISSRAVSCAAACDTAMNADAAAISQASIRSLIDDLL
jgi:hypothetical protein